MAYQWHQVALRKLNVCQTCRWISPCFLEQQPRSGPSKRAINTTELLSLQTGSSTTASMPPRGPRYKALSSYEPEQHWRLHRDKIVGCSCSTGVFELQVSQRLILPTCRSGACKTARSFLGNNCIFCLWYEIFQDWKTPKTSNKRGKFSLSCSIQSTGWANKIYTEVWDETYIRERKEGQCTSRCSLQHLIFPSSRSVRLQCCKQRSDGKKREFKKYHLPQPKGPCSPSSCHPSRLAGGRRRWAGQKRFCIRSPAASPP